MLQVCTNNLNHTRLSLFNRGRPVIDLLKSIAYRLLNFKLFGMAEFAAAAVAAVPTALYYSIRKRASLYSCSFAGMGAFCLAMPVIQGQLYYRTCQTFGLFIAIIVLMVVEIFRNKRGLRAFCCVRRGASAHMAA